MSFSKLAELLDLSGSTVEGAKKYNILWSNDSDRNHDQKVPQMVVEVSGNSLKIREI